MNTTIRNMRPDLLRQFEQKVGMSYKEFLGEYTYTHHMSGREITSDIFPMHHLAFQDGCIHAENVGGDLAQVLNRRAIIGAFPWKIEGGEACPCRIMAFFDCGEEEVIEGLGSAIG